MIKPSIAILTPSTWKDYQLIDSGNFEKLEKFGRFILIRPEPQAVWDKSLSEEEWMKRAHALFRRDKSNPEHGKWEILKKEMREPWTIDYSSKALTLKGILRMSSFKHVGLFPEQATNWEYMAEKLTKLPKGAKVLNLFAYTGMASVAAKYAGADITHLDSVKPVVTWAKENMEASGLDNIRWMVDDAMKFVRREVKRGKKYNGLILDPPAYGRGPEGEKWVLEEHINEMLKLCSQLLEKDFFFIINLYSLGFSSLIVENLLKCSFPQLPNLELGELYLNDSFDKKLPLGIYARFSSAT